MRPAIRQESASAISLVVGLAVRDALMRHLDPERISLGIKWPNDIVHRRRKLAGILIEMSQTPDKSCAPAIVVGVGINLGAVDFPAELRELGTSLAVLAEAPPPRREILLFELLEALERRIESFTIHGVEPCLAELERYDALRGYSVRVDEVVGIASGITARGELLLQSEGTQIRIASGTVVYDETGT